MKVKLFALSVVAAFVFSGFVMAEEMMAKEVPAAAVEKAAPVVVGNKVCPVLGNNIPADQLGQNTVEYKGKVYNLCCMMCKEKFLSDPEKFSKIAEDSVVSAVADKEAVAEVPVADMPVADKK